MNTVQTESAELLEHGWAALPEAYRMPAVTPSVPEALAWCERLTVTHYENFHVASWFLPARLRPHFHAIYAYCRVADDLGDEVGDAAQSRALLDLWERQLDRCYAAGPDSAGDFDGPLHPVFVALRETIRACAIPREPFADLLTAFRQDQAVTRFATLDDVMQYCRYSANPVGRLVLYAAGYGEDPRRDAMFALSDWTCSALQLANFWQDVREDYVRGRVYIPQEDMARYGVTEGVIAGGRATAEFLSLMRYELLVARKMFRRGLPLIRMVDAELAVDLDLFSRGGLEILRAIERQGCDVLRARPTVSKTRKGRLLLRAIVGTAASRLRGGSRRDAGAATDAPASRAR